MNPIPPPPSATDRAIDALGRTNTRSERRQIIIELPPKVLPQLRAHFAAFPSCFPVGREVVAVIDKQTGKVKRSGTQG